MAQTSFKRHLPRRSSTGALMVAAALFVSHGLAGSGAARAQCEPHWLPGEGIPGINGFGIEATTSWDPDGPGPQPELLVVGGGYLTVAGTVAANQIAAWDGSSWHPLGSGMIGEVRALTVYNGELIAGGEFSTAGGVSANCIARWDGSSWNPLGSGMVGGAIATYVSALTVYNGELIAGGRFNTAGGVSANHIARWDGSSWHPLGSGMDNAASSVYALAIFNGELIAGGYFTAAGGVSAKNIARWDGSSWHSLGSGMVGAFASTYVAALTVSNGELIAGGEFITVDGVSASNIARWDGSSWNALGSGLTGELPDFSSNPSVEALTVYDGELIAGGNFDAAGGVSVNRIARWNGVSWNPLGSGMTGGELVPQFPTTVAALTAFNGELIAGGLFAAAGDTGVDNIARWNGTSWNPVGSGMDDTVNVFTDFNGELIAGGEFVAAGDVNANHIARWDGSSWSPLGSGMNDDVDALATYNDDLIAGGLFTTAGGVNANRIARWDGSSWHSLDGGMMGGREFDITVKALTVFNGELIAGGHFDTAGGVSVNHIARWDGLSWHPLGSGMTLSGGSAPSVHALTIYNGELIAGGGFITAGGVSAKNVARWDGSSWHPLGSGMSSPVRDLTVYNGDLIAGGFFGTAGGASAHHVARWDGSSWYPLGSGTSGNVVLALAVYNEELIAGGAISSAGGVSAENIARWDGSSWHPLGSGISGGSDGSAVYALTAYNGDLVAGGNFTIAGGQVSGYWARCEIGAAAPADLNCDGGVDGFDLALLLGQWTGAASYVPCPPYAPADLNADCKVNGFDLSLVLAAWG